MTGQPIEERHDVDASTFTREVGRDYRPVVLRGLVKDWPIVAEARRSPEHAAAYLHARDSGHGVDAIMTPPEARGRIFYNAGMTGFNFLRNTLPVSQVLQQILRYAQFDAPPAVAVQSALIADCLPGFLDSHVMPLLPAAIAPRIWIGNRVTTPTHFDESNNIACVVAGRRRFTLFPPEQIANLYIGPIDFAPTGTPISLVDLAEPDFGRYPKFRDALASAFVAELEPGDAIYMPALWWHHVESLTAFNVLVNYWWQGNAETPAARDDSMRDVLLHGLLAMNGLAPELREAWRGILDHYLFHAGAQTVEHIPPARRGVLGDIDPSRAEQVRAILRDKLQP